MTTLAITGMTCNHCRLHVQEALGRVPGVVSAEVDLAAGLAQVAGSAPLAALVAAVEAEGYRAAEVHP